MGTVTGAKVTGKERRLTKPTVSKSVLQRTKVTPAGSSCWLPLSPIPRTGEEEKQSRKHGLTLQPQVLTPQFQ